jgi:hypothetical protein
VVVAALVAVTFVLAFTRPLALAVPATLGLTAMIALLRRARAWNWLAAAAVATVVPILAFTAYVSVIGYPGLIEQLQDLPTKHFRLPPVSDPVAVLVMVNQAQLPSLVQSWAGEPLLVLASAVALAGYAARRQLWTVPFLIGAAAVVGLLVLHPVKSEAPRLLSPIWTTIHLGIGLLVGELVRFGGDKYEGWRASHEPVSLSDATTVHVGEARTARERAVSWFTARDGRRHDLKTRARSGSGKEGPGGRSDAARTASAGNG